MSQRDGGVFYRRGRLAGGKARKAKWVWHSLAGDQRQDAEP